MNNLSSYYGLVDTKIRASEKDLPVKKSLSLSGHMIYQVTSWLFPMGFPEASTKLVTNKRFSDFQKLHKALNQIHKNLHLTGKLLKIMD